MRSFIVTSAALCLILLLSVGCTPDTASDLIQKKFSLFPATVGTTVDVGNGVYYFASVQSDFAHSLSAFIAMHPELQLVSMAGDGSGSYGSDRGYFVVFRPTTR